MLAWGRGCVCRCEAVRICDGDSCDRWNIRIISKDDASAFLSPFFFFEADLRDGHVDGNGHGLLERALERERLRGTGCSYLPSALSILKNTEPREILAIYV
jgi:hypothetical protein